MPSPYQGLEQQHEILNQEFKNFWAEQDTIDAEKAARAAAEKADDQFWGFIESPESLKNREQLPEYAFRLEDVIKETWCARHYKTPPRLVKFLRRYGYPARILDLGFTTKAGFGILLEQKLATERKSDRAQKIKTRAIERAANQVPEPIIGAKRGTPSGESA